METMDHRALKRLARSFARAIGCCAVASEVVAPVPRWRVDVAGYGDGPATSSLPGATGERSGSPALQPSNANSTRPSSSLTSNQANTRPTRPRTPFTIIIECKQSRADFLRETRDRAALLRRRRALERDLREIESTLLPACEPHLRIPLDPSLGPALFPELDAWDHARSGLPAYRAALRDLARVDRALYGDTKFCCLAAWRLADLLYIAAPRGMIRPDELPSGWGLLEFTRPSKATEPTAPRLDASLSSKLLSTEGGEDVTSPPGRRDRRGVHFAPEQPDDQFTISALRVLCEGHACQSERRVRLLRNIAVKACKGSALRIA